MFFRAPERDLENMFGLTQRTSQILVGEYTLRNVIEGFLRDRKASNLSPRTLGFYREKLMKFESYCRERNIWTVDVLNADIIRSYMLYMAEVRGNNKGMCTAFTAASAPYCIGLRTSMSRKDGRTPSRRSRLQNNPRRLLNLLVLMSSARCWRPVRVKTSLMTGTGRCCSLCLIWEQERRNS